jgi:Cns1/TTC4 Wheel domain
MRIEFQLLLSYLFTVALRKYEEGSVACAEGLAVEPENSQILQLKSKCDKEILSIKTTQREFSAKLVMKEKHWRAAWDIMSATGRGKEGTDMIGVGYASAGQNPAQLQETLPHYVMESPADTASVGWPVLLLYPQYSQIDVIQGVPATDMLAIHLGEMFPELADLDSTVEGGCAVPWDRDREYHVSRLAVYAPLEAVPRICTVEQWLLFCREQSAIRGEMGAEACEAATEIARKRSEAYDRSLLNSKSKAGGFLDVHLGSTFQTIMRAPGHVLAGGLLSLLVFVRGNEAHSNFLSDVRKRGSSVWSLSPSGSIERTPV